MQINGGVVVEGPPLRLSLPPTARGYADAQVDDYHRRRRPDYPWRPGVELRLRARFSHPAGGLVGTAGFGFWNAPFGDPTVRWPVLPQAVWFFYASAPSDLPLAAAGPGRGWFAATLDATAGRALAPLAPIILLLNQSGRLRRRLWPAVQRRLGISYTQLDTDLSEWHDYYLAWRNEGCLFTVGGREVLRTSRSPRGPLGFVCWMDNQYLIATPRGRLAWGVLPTTAHQWMEIEALTIVKT
ncbi:MAG: hypothetical protein AB1791_01760 [Chloroflexota bacterium]